ncbi:hypothetical protein JTB14_035024 [Gonioctena quinquepunctata]|nr:hypothetical protein JTB14_035024 [Gonioctena quinquepunctata]
MQSNNNSVFKCCKKASTYSTCIKCSGIFHKTCLNRAKKNYEFLANNHVICCAEEQAQEATEEISTLEITIQDLTEDTVLKSKHIQKLKSENDKFAQEAIKVETELNDIIDQQKKYIEDTVLKSKHIQKTSEKEYVMKNTGTQTCSHRDQVPSMNEKSLASGVAGKKAAAVNKNELKPSHHGRDMAKFLLLQNEYEYMTQTILKPNYHPNILIDTAIKNSETFTKKDIVIIWTERMTSPIESRLIPNTTHTNLIVVTQPFRYDNEEMNDYISQRIYNQWIHYNGKRKVVRMQSHLESNINNRN